MASRRARLLHEFPGSSDRQDRRRKRTDLWLALLRRGCGRNSFGDGNRQRFPLYFWQREGNQGIADRSAKKSAASGCHERHVLTAVTAHVSDRCSVSIGFEPGLPKQLSRIRIEGPETLIVSRCNEHDSSRRSNAASEALG